MAASTCRQYDDNQSSTMRGLPAKSDGSDHKEEINQNKHFPRVTDKALFTL